MFSSDDPIVITHAKRSPMGALLGQFKDLSASDLAGQVIASLLQSTPSLADTISEVYMGCVLTAGQGQAPARQAALKGGLPLHVPATTLNKMCGSGMKAVMLGSNQLCAETQDVILAGGMESMSAAPYLLKKARSGYRLGHSALIDHLFMDGLEDAYETGKLMGIFADKTAAHLGITREQQDAFALTSLQRSQTAIQQGYFEAEITSIQENTLTHAQDEGPLKARPEKIKQLKPAFSPEGTVTAANASSISDGAAALILMRASRAKQLGLTPLAKIVGQASYAQEPAWFTTAPVFAIQTLLKRIRWDKESVDLYEINEAFAVVTLAAIDALGLSSQQVNINGGACALGHPIGASGARILVTLIHALRQQDLKRGIAALCIGGGEATAIAIERMD